MTFVEEMAFLGRNTRVYETPASPKKSTCNPSKGHPCLEVFLSQVENELFEITKQDLRYFIYLRKNGEL